MKKRVIYIVLCVMLIITGCKEKETKKDSNAVPLVIDSKKPAEDAESEVKKKPESDVKEKSEKDSFCEDINKIFEPYNDGHMSLYVKNISDGKECAAASRKMQAASLIKLYVAGSVYENYKSVSDYLGGENAVEELMKKMITISDNEASNQLTLALGKGNDTEGKNVVNKFCANHGYSDTHMGRLLLQKNETDDNYTSVTDCGKILGDIYNNDLQSSDKILNYMKQQERVAKIPAGIPSGIVVANKTGELSDVENDVAIVFSENKPYIICLMADKLSDTYSTRQKEVDISSKMYSYICGE